MLASEAGRYAKERHMTLIHGGARHVTEFAGRVLGHLAVAVLGFALMVTGLAMGVTMVLLPVGVVVGSVGVLMFVWGLFGHLKSPVH
jgi:hypothetical protein